MFSKNIPLHIYFLIDKKWQQSNQSHPSIYLCGGKKNLRIKTLIITLNLTLLTKRNYKNPINSFIIKTITQQFYFQHIALLDYLYKRKGFRPGFNCK